MQNKTFKLGDMGEAVVHGVLKRVYADVRETPKEIDAQLKWADFVCVGEPDFGIPHTKVEVKTELEHTGNLFFETWSNKSTGRLGWAYTSTADEFFYLFWEAGIGYRIPEFQRVMWLFDYHRRDFREVEQGKHIQENDTWGCLVPIAWLKSNFSGVVEFNFEAEKKPPVLREAS
jgi:hypothetical protein